MPRLRTGKTTRQAERYARLEREVRQLEAAVVSRSHVIARTTSGSARCWARLGYLGRHRDPDGGRLADLYTELDLLAASACGATSGMALPASWRPASRR
jgi:hypothetical protein